VGSQPCVPFGHGQPEAARLLGLVEISSKLAPQLVFRLWNGHDERGRVARAFKRVTAFLLPVALDRTRLPRGRREGEHGDLAQDVRRELEKRARGSLAVRGGGGRAFDCSQTTSFGHF